MTTRSVDRLEIHVVVAASTLIEFRSPSEGLLLRVESPLNEAQLPAFRQKLQAGLSDLQTSLIAPKQTVQNAFTHLKAFHTVGRRLLFQLFGDQNLSDLDTASRICRAACFGTENSETIRQQPVYWSPQALEPQCISVTTRFGDALALEVLPLLYPYQEQWSANLDDLARLARHFLGFAAIVHRQPSEQTPARLQNLPDLALRLFTCGSLPSSDRVRELFRRSPGFAINLEWPPKVNSAKTDVADLAEALWRQDAPLEGTGKVPIQLHHFNCHCEASEEGSLLRINRRREGIRTLASGLSPIRIPADALADELRDLRAEAFLAGDRSKRPLVFLNACASANVNPGELSPFPELFRQLDFLGFIGTHVTLPDAFGSNFVERFYAELLSGEPLGRALFAAAWQTLQEDKNPLGLIYLLYADPMIRVATPIKMPKTVESSLRSARDPA